MPPPQSSQLQPKPLASPPAPPLPRGTARDQGSQRHRERGWPSPPLPSPNIHSPSLQPQGTPGSCQPAGVCGCRAGTSWEFGNRRPGGHWTLPAATLGQHPGWPLHSLPGPSMQRRGEGREDGEGRRVGSRGPGTSAVRPSPVSSDSHPGDTAEGSEGPRQAEAGREEAPPTTPPLAASSPTVLLPTAGDCTHARCQGEAGSLPGLFPGSTSRPAAGPACVCPPSGSSQACGCGAGQGVPGLALGCSAPWGQQVLTRKSDGRGLAGPTGPCCLATEHSRAKGHMPCRGPPLP